MSIMYDKEYFMRRGTVRSYTSEEISSEKLAEMIEAASHAPNTGNMQWYSVVVTRSPEAKAVIAPAHFNQPQVQQASAVLTFCLDLRRFERWCRQSDADPGFENFQSFVAAIIDTSLFAQQFCTIAEMEDYGTCYLGTTTYNAPQITEALKLPRRVVPVTTVTVGRPAAPVSPSLRVPVEAILHDETYREPTDEQIAGWYAAMEEDSRRFTEENNKKALAQVFTDVRYPRESAEYFSKVYYDMLRENGFV